MYGSNIYIVKHIIIFLCIENGDIVGEKTNLDLFFLTYLLIYLTDFYTSCIGMCEITYLTYFIKVCKCLRSIVVKL